MGRLSGRLRRLERRLGQDDPVVRDRALALVDDEDLTLIVAYGERRMAGPASPTTEERCALARFTNLCRAVREGRVV